MNDPLESFDEVPESSQQLILSSTSTPAKSESSNTSGSEETSDFERFRGPYVSMQDYDPQSDTALSDVSSQPEHVTHPSLEECWIVTPPPCFTASESTAGRVRMHPLENLLIEHPSMSVYWPRDRLNLEADHDLEDVDEEPGEGQSQAQEAQVKDRAVENVVQGGCVADGAGDVVSPHEYQVVVDFNQILNYHSPLYFAHDQRIRIREGSLNNMSTTESSPSNMPPTTGSSISMQQLEAGSSVLNTQPRGSAYSFLTPHNIRLTANRLGSYLGVFVHGGRTVEEQKAQKQSARQENSRKVLDHQNRVHEFASSGKIRQRKDRMGCPSGRSNNRKC